MKRKGTGAYLSAVSAATVAAIIIGCGGSGESGPSAPTGDAAVRSMSVGSYQSLASGIAFPFAGVVASAPAGSGIHTLAMLSPRYRKYVVHPSGALLQLDPELNLYSDGGVTTSTGKVIHYFTDAAGSNSAGTMTLTSPTGSFTYTSYPVAIDLAVDVTAGNLPCHGSATITFGGETGANGLKGTLNLTKNSEVVSVDMTLSPSLQVGGTMKVVENGTTISATNLNGPLAGDIALDFTLDPQGYGGNGTINLNTSKIALTFSHPTGASCTLDAGGNLVIQYPSGKKETVKNPLTSTLLTGGGGTGTTASTATATTATATTSTATTATATTSTASTSGASNAKFATPVKTDWGTPTYYTLPKQIFSSNKFGEIVGVSSDAPVFAASPVATPQLLKTSAKTGTAYSINSGRMIVGNVAITGGLQAVIWTSPTATATPLKLPKDTRTSAATGINESGQIIGYAFGAGFGEAIYWSSYKATPVVVPPSPTINGARPSQIDDAGHLFGFSGNGNNYVWTSPTATPTTLLGFDSSHGNYAMIQGPLSFSSKGVVGASGINSGTGFATIWSPPSYAAAKVPVTTSAAYSELYAINNQGEMTGWFAHSDGSARPSFWLPGKTQQDLLPLMTATIPAATRGVGQAVLNDGSLIVTAGDKAGGLLGFYYLKRIVTP